jgi:hypothetical protein
MSDPRQPRPTGAWDMVIEHLTRAHELMEEMHLAEPFEEDSLGNIFKRQIETMIATVTTHYQALWWEIATKPVRVIIRDDGTVEPL